MENQISNNKGKNMEFNKSKFPDISKNRYGNVQKNLEEIDIQYKNIIANKNVEIRNKQGKILELKASCDAINKNYLELEKKLIKEKSFHENIIKQKESKFKVLEEMFQNAEIKYKKHIFELQQQLSNMEKEKLNLRIEREKSSSEDERLTAKNNQLKDSLEIMNNQMKELQEELIRKREYAAKLQQNKEEQRLLQNKEIEELQQGLADKDKFIAELRKKWKQDVLGRENEIESLQQSIYSKDDNISEMQKKEKQQLLAKDKEIKAINNKLEEYKNTMEKKIEELERLLRNKEEILARKESPVPRETIEKIIHPLASEVGKENTLDELIFGIAHQLRNPLGIIKSNAQLSLENERTDEFTKKQLTVIIKNATNMTEKLDKFLEFTKHMKLSFQEISLSKLLEQLKYVIQERCKKQNVTLAENINRDLPLMMLDPQGMKEALLNVLINSLDALPKGGVISVNGLYDKEHGKVIVEIEDNGTGIAKIHESEIFMPFFTTKEDKMGIGLTYTRQIIQAHHGNIEVKSREGQGTKVIISLPVLT